MTKGTGAPLFGTVGAGIDKALAAGVEAGLEGSLAATTWRPTPGPASGRCDVRLRALDNFDEHAPNSIREYL